MIVSLQLKDFKIQTECSKKLKKDTLMLKSPKEKINYSYRCDFKLKTLLHSIPKQLSFGFEIIMNFDPDGSNLDILLNDERIYRSDFVALLDKNIHQGQWGTVIIRFPINQSFNVTELTLDFQLFHGDDPFSVQIKDLYLKEG